MESFTLLVLVSQNYSISNALDTSESSVPDNETNWVLLHMIYITGALSTLGCLFNIIISIFLKLHQNVLGKMIINLCCNEVLFVWSFIMMVRYSEDYKIISDIASVVNVMSWIGSGELGLLLCSCILLLVNK